MSELSPAAQAVFWEFNSAFDWVQDAVPGPQYKAIAAALRAAVDHCHSQKIREADHTTRQWICVDDLLAIAAELESQ
jgi:hypothetical protein